MRPPQGMIAPHDSLPRRRRPFLPAGTARTRATSAFALRRDVTRCAQPCDRVPRSACGLSVFGAGGGSGLREGGAAKTLHFAWAAALSSRRVAGDSLGGIVGDAAGVGGDRRGSGGGDQARV